MKIKFSLPLLYIISGIFVFGLMSLSNGFFMERREILPYLILIVCLNFLCFFFSCLIVAINGIFKQDRIHKAISFSMTELILNSGVAFLSSIIALLWFLGTVKVPILDTLLFLNALALLISTSVYLGMNVIASVTYLTMFSDKISKTEPSENA